MDSSTKRKDAPGDGPQGPHRKKSKGGHAGKWQTPHQKEKLEAMRSKVGMLEVGDVGFWTTCQRHKEVKALDELVALCEEYGEKVYGVKPGGGGEDSGDEDGDIESSIQKEIESMRTSSKSRREDSVFDPMRLNMDCLLFVKTKAPVEPRGFIRRICDDAKLITDKTQRKSRFINRFTPISAMGKATEHGVDEVARTVLSEQFQLAGVDDKTLGEQSADHSYAIRFSSRAHNVLKRDAVIKQVAALIGPRHKVNLTTPDKVILIEIYQTFCGMSVVDGDWEAMKRYNLNELYETALKASRSVDAGADSEEKPEQAAST